MLLVPTYTAPSAIHGRGLFAAEDIPKGACVWEFDPDIDGMLRLDVILGKPVYKQVLLGIYCYEAPAPHKGHYIWCGDEGRFINHSLSPTLCDADNLCHALFDLPKGTELTSNYAHFGATVEPIDWQAEAERYSHLLLEWGGQRRPYLNGHAPKGEAWVTG